MPCWELGMCADRRAKGTEVFVGGLPRSATEGTLREAAARVLCIGSRTDFLLGGLHPAINWAEKQSHVDADEMDKELDIAIKEMNGKTVRGPDRGPAFRIQVSVARPAVENDKKRIREEVQTRGSNVSRDRPDYSYGRYGHDSFDRQAKAPRQARLSNAVADITDPYEAAIISLPSAVKELLHRILRLGIGTRYNIDIHCIKSLNELPESAAVAVLNQFLIAGADKRNKGDYFASLIAKYQVKTFGGAQILQETTYLPRSPGVQNKQFSHEEYIASRSSRYNSLGDYPSSSYIDDPTVSQSRIRRYAEERPAVVRYPEPRLQQEEISSIGRYPEPRLAHEPRQNTGRHLDRRYIQEQSSNIERSAEGAVLPRERRFLSAAGYRTDIVPEFSSRSSAEYSTERQQIRFDPFTGEPYKFDPFTGEPIRPESNPHCSGSLYRLD